MEAGGGGGLYQGSHSVIYTDARLSTARVSHFRRRHVGRLCSFVIVRFATVLQIPIPVLHSTVALMFYRRVPGVLLATSGASDHLVIIIVIKREKRPRLAQGWKANAAKCCADWHDRHTDITHKPKAGSVKPTGCARCRVPELLWKPKERCVDSTKRSPRRPVFGVIAKLCAICRVDGSRFRSGSF
jgi:hypothetical protein